MANNYDLSDLESTGSSEPQNFDLSDLVAEEAMPEAEPSLMQKAGVLGALGKGAVSGAVGAIPDILSMPYNLLTQETSAVPSNLTPQELEEFSRKTGRSSAPPQNLPQIPSVTEAVSKGIGKFAGETPEEYKSLEKGAEFLGGLAGPGGMAKGAAKLGQAGVAKALGRIGTTKATELAGAGLAGTAMGELQEAGYGLPAQLAGAIGAGAVGTGAAKALKQLTRPPSETIGKVLSFRAKPDPRLKQYEKDLDIKIPWNIHLDSDMAHGAANTWLDTMFASSKYKADTKAATQSHIDAVKKRIASISPDKLDKEAASANFLEHLSDMGKNLKKEADTLYERARSYLKPDDMMVPDTTIKTMNDIKAKLQKTLKPSTDEKWALKQIEDLEKAMGVSPSHKINLEHIAPERRAEVLKKYGEEIRHKPEINLDQLTSTRSSLMRDINYGNEMPRGAKGFMKGIVGALEKDIANSGNKEFLDHWKAANSFFKAEIAEGVRSDFGRSLHEGTFPKLAFNYMSDPRAIAKLEKFAGNTPAGKQVMDSLKRAKLEQVVVDKVMNADGSMSYAHLSNLFLKNSGQAPMLKALLGTKRYNDFVKLGEIAQKTSASGKVLASPSKTAPRTFDMARIGSLITSATTANIPVIAGIASETGAVNLFSRLVSNEKYIDAAVKHAEARAANKLTDAGKYQREMRQVFLKQILPSIRESQKEKAPE